jgi:hypothetical protein
MKEDFDFDKYWGVQVIEARFDSKAMAISLDVFWTADSNPQMTTLRFEGVSKFELSAEKTFQSEVVEMVSIGGKHSNGNWRIVGEFSNYEFLIVCMGIKENRHVMVG